MSRPIVVIANFFLRRLACVSVIFALVSLAAAVQQPAVGRQKTPRMTSDDVARPVGQPSDEPKAAAAKSEEAGKTVATKPGEKKAGPEEVSWREGVNKARDRAKELQRAAEEAELRITALRNDLGASGQSARYRNDTAAELEQAGRRLAELRDQARAADDDLAQLVEYGKEKGFTESEEPKPIAEEGKPNEQYYRAQLAKLKEEIESAQRRAHLYQNRLNDVSQRILMNGGKNGGDNFYLFQLQKDREEAQQQLDESRAALAKAQADLEALKEDARRAGVTPDLFR